jgi:hypothetical protein
LFPVENNAITCSGPDPANCTNGEQALIAFHGDVAPFVNFAPEVASQTESATNADRPLGLTKDGVTVSPPPPSGTDVGKFTTTITGFLTPQLVGVNNVSESGTPFIDSNGFLTRLQVGDGSVPATQNTIFALIEKNPALSAFKDTPGNNVNNNWKQGIAAYYANKYADAQRDFEQAAKDNPNFQGANDFATFAQKARNPGSSASRSESNGPGFFLPGTNIFVGLWISSVVALVVVALLLLLTSSVVRSRVKRRRAFEAELDDAARDAAVAVQQIEAMEATRRDRLESELAAEQFTLLLRQRLQSKTVMSKVSNLRCPRCGEHVAYNSNYCSNCCLVLSPTESGQHLRISPSTSPAPSSTTSTPRVEFDATDIKADINVRQIMEQKGEY